MDAEHTTHGRRYTVNEAAEVLDISAEAVRARINRGTLHKEKDRDGAVYVRLDAEHTHTNDDHTDVHTVPESVAFQLMSEQVDYLRGVLETRDKELSEMRRLLAGALERIPELEASSELRESPVTPSEGHSGMEEGPGASNGQAQPMQGRSWWRRFFGIE